MANVDPAAFERATRGLDARKTLAIVVSKSWETAETLRNAAKVDAPESPKEAVRLVFLSRAPSLPPSVSLLERGGASLRSRDIFA